MERKNPIPPYVAYRTFRNFLVQLEKQGLPGRIDRSVLSHKSGTVQSQLLLALEFLGLIPVDEIPVTAQDGRVTRVEIDPAGFAPDVDRANNFWPRG